MTGQLDQLNTSLSQTTDQVSQCLLSQTTDHDLIVTQTTRLDQLEASTHNQTTGNSDLQDRLDKVKDALMVTSRDFGGKQYFLSEPMWRNTAAYAGVCQLFGGGWILKNIFIFLFDRK